MNELGFGEPGSFQESIGAQRRKSPAPHLRESVDSWNGGTMPLIPLRPNDDQEALRVANVLEYNTRRSINWGHCAHAFLVGMITSSVVHLGLWWLAQ